MNLVPGVTGPRVAGENHPDNTFFHRDLVADFKLRFVLTPSDGSMWTLLHLSHCDAPGTTIFAGPALTLKYGRSHETVLVIPFLALVPFVTTAQDQPAGTWLDSPTVQWNRAGAGILLPDVVGPRRAQNLEKNTTPKYCKVHERPVRSQEERIVADAGWLVFTSLQGNNGLTVVGGAFSLDGMCRPDPYQYFVFVRGNSQAPYRPGS